MKIDVLARGQAGPGGGPNGMAIAAAYLAHTLARLGHEVRKLDALDGFGADMVISTIQPTWRRTAAAWLEHRELSSLVYWHHAGGVPPGPGCILAAPPSVGPQGGEWSRQIVLPPSSWAVESGGDCVGDSIIVAGAGPAKGGHVALEVAKLCPDLRWFVLQSRSAPSDRAPWLDIPGAELAQGIVAPDYLWSRARAVLSPTRFDVHPLLLVEAAVRGIPIVCTDMLATRCAAGHCAIYQPVNAEPHHWAEALRLALLMKPAKLQLRPYLRVVSEALDELRFGRAAA